jgi:hypothetical protein
MLITELGPVEGHLVSWKKARTVVHFTYMERGDQKWRNYKKKSNNGKFYISRSKKKSKLNPGKAGDLRKPIVQNMSTHKELLC